MSDGFDAAASRAAGEELARKQRLDAKKKGAAKTKETLDYNADHFFDRLPIVRAQMEEWFRTPAYAVFSPSTPDSYIRHPRTPAPPSPYQRLDETAEHSEEKVDELLMGETWQPFRARVNLCSTIRGARANAGRYGVVMQFGYQNLQMICPAGGIVVDSAKMPVTEHEFAERQVDLWAAHANRLQKGALR